LKKFEDEEKNVTVY